MENFIFCAVLWLYQFIQALLAITSDKPTLELRGASRAPVYI